MLWVPSHPLREKAETRGVLCTQSQEHRDKMRDSRHQAALLGVGVLCQLKNVCDKRWQPAWVYVYEDKLIILWAPKFS